MRWLLTFLIGTPLLTCFAQNKLLFMKNKHHEVVYEKGDVLSFRLRGDKVKHTAQIESIEDSVIVFRYYQVQPEEITHLYLDKTNKVLWFMKYKYERLFFISGIGYLLLDTFNHGEPNENTLIVSGSLIGAGFLAHWLIGKRIPVHGKKKIVILKGG